MALLGALMLSVIVLGIAVGVGLRSTHDIGSSARREEAARAAALFGEVERQSQKALLDDGRRGASDDNAEAWASGVYLGTLADGRAEGRLRDLQGRFNLNSLAFDPGGGVGGDLPLPAGLSSDASDPASALFAATATDAVDNSADNATLDADVAAAEAAAPGNGSSGKPPAIDPGMQALATIPAVAATLNAANGGNAAAGLTLTPQQIAIGRFALLLRALDLDEALLPALLDWLDSDSDTRFPNGAEDDYYTELPAPYRAANRAFSDVSELALVRGFDAAVRARLAPHVSVLPGMTPINVNTADPTVLMSLAPALDASAAQMIVAARESQPFTSLDAFMNLPVLFGRPLVASGLATASNYFQLDMHAESGRSLTRARTLVGRPDQSRVLLMQRYLGHADD